MAGVAVTCLRDVNWNFRLPSHAKAVKESDLQYALHLSSYGAHVPEGTGPVTGLHSSEQKLNAISGLNVLHLRAAYFMENNLAMIGMIQKMGVFGHVPLPHLKLPMIATRDVGDYAAQRLLGPGFFWLNPIAHTGVISLDY